MAAKTRRGAAPEYVSGTAARKLEPERRQERPREPRREASSQSRTVTVRRNQEKALQMDLPYVIVLTIAAVCTLYFCVSYLQLQSSIAARLNHIEALEASIEKKKADNDAGSIRPSIWTISIRSPQRSWGWSMPIRTR